MGTVSPAPQVIKTGLGGLENFAMGGAGYIGIEWSGVGPNLEEFIIYRNGINHFIKNFVRFW